MESTYDENISENPFYRQFIKEFKNLYEHCITESWIICVPRIGSLISRVFTVEDFCSHILVPNDELPETHYSTLTEKQVTVINKVITLEVTKDIPLQSHILFEETFYTEDRLKYIVWCIETPLAPSASREDNTLKYENLSSINDCIDLLWTQAAGRQILDQIEFNVKTFLEKHYELPLAIAPLRDLVGELYTHCLQAALQNRRLRERTKTCKHILENVKVAVESYMQHLLYDSLFKPICTCCAFEDSHLNKKVRNLCDIQLTDLDIRKDLYHTVPRAKQILSQINNYSTVLEKVICIKRSLNAIKKTDNGNNKIVLLTVDDMLPILVFLVIKSGLPNWYSQLMFLKEFRFSASGKGDCDEASFLITTLEAVLEHIRSDALTGPPHPESYYYETDLTDEKFETAKDRRTSLTESVSTSDTNGGEETLEYIFDLIKVGHRDQVCAILEKNKKQIAKMQNSALDAALEMCSINDDDDVDDEGEVPTLCHPLCNCNKCNKKIFKNLLKTSPTIMSRDSHGLTALHMACIHGKSNIVESLIEMGAEINVTDLNECTPLHYAASRGHQNSLLLLIHSGANIIPANIDKNTPLHVSVNNGHLNCVKALIYYAEHSKKNININCMNINGNTPLHMASKWGYEGIAKLLIENGAEPSLQNCNAKSAFDYAHNLRMLQILKSCTPNLFEYIHISDINLNSKPTIPQTEKTQFKNIDVTKVYRSLENLKKMDRIAKAISHNDIKLACFYLNIEYDPSTSKEVSRETAFSVCHPLCDCKHCKIKNSRSEFDINFTDSNGHTALHYAAKYGSEEICKILLSNKAHVNCANKKGETPLHLAAFNNKTTIMRILIENGANVNSIDSSGNTALHNASQMGNIVATKILINNRPDVTILNGSEKTALAIAKDKVHLTIIDIIEKYYRQNID